MSSPLDVAELRSALAGQYPAVDVVASTGSTNADLLAASADGALDRTVLIAETQTAGRGRRARRWVSPPGSGLYLSVLLRPSEVAAPALGTLSMVAGLALADAGATETDRSAIAIALLTRFAELEARWRSAGGSLAASGLLKPYRERCATVGAHLRVELPDGRTRTGVGRDIDGDGKLLVTGDDGVSFAVSAGDVVHVRY